ncbi:RHS repeat-associated core domain-containing protein [bacterium]|nr:RHS repeat-associated core domain-containing protein [bacterium]
MKNRLKRVQGRGSVDLNYQYDMAGRMISRDDGTSITTFWWDYWDCVRESTPTSTTTYLIPEGVLLGFVRDGETYFVSSDALGSCRLVTDASGVVKARFDHGAFGETLATSFDNVPGGMPYSWIGSLGVRYDSATGLCYMRQRWYDPTLQRFISRDPIGIAGGKNVYVYCANHPVSLVDPSGLRVSQLEGDQFQAFTDALGLLRDLGGDYSEVAGLLAAIQQAKKIHVEDPSDLGWGEESTRAITTFDKAHRADQVIRINRELVFANETIPKKLQQKLDCDPELARNYRLWVRRKRAVLLASTLYHEMWHYRFRQSGPGEPDAYAAESEFLKALLQNTPKIDVRRHDAFYDAASDIAADMYQSNTPWDSAHPRVLRFPGGAPRWDSRR